MIPVRSTLNAIRQFALIASVLLIAPGCAVEMAHSEPLTSENADQQVQELIAAHDFLGLFQNADRLSTEKYEEQYVISDAAMQFIRSCCNNAEDAVRLLSANGFEPTNSRKECKPVDRSGSDNHHQYSPDQECKEVGKIADAPKYRGQGFDDIYVGKRAAFFGPNLYAYRVYKVVLYIKNGAVSKVSAGSYLESL